MINYFKIKNIIAVMALSGVVMLQSCDDEVYDFVGDPNNLAYAKIAPDKLICEAVQTPEEDFNNVKVEFPVRLTKRAEQTNVGVELDNSLIQAYNTANEKSYLQLPEGAIIINKASVTVSEGEWESGDSILITMDNTKVAALEAGKIYLAPIKVVPKTGNVKTSKSLGVAYIRIEAKKEVFKRNGGPADMIGALNTNYSSWTYTSANTTNAISNLWSSSTTQGLTFNVSPSTIVFNMNEVKKVTGIRAMNRNGTSSNSSFSNIKLSFSTDGVTYQEIADLPRGRMAAVSGYQYICLYEAMEAQYLKLEFTWTQNTRLLVQFGVYVEN